MEIGAGSGEPVFNLTDQHITFIYFAWVRVLIFPGLFRFSIEFSGISDDGIIMK